MAHFWLAQWLGIWSVTTYMKRWVLFFAIFFPLNWFFMYQYVLGQTTDSGSNNRTMASEMELMFAAAEKTVDWDSSQMHARCYCHKLALVVRAGLKSISIESGHSKPTTDPNLAVPVPTFQLNNEDIQVDAESADSDDEDPSDECDQVSSSSSDEEMTGKVANDTGKGITNANIFATAVNKVSFFNSSSFDSMYHSSNWFISCDQVDTVSKKIAGSHSRRQQFRGLCKESGLDHRTPIAGYGIRWNVIYDSRNRMCAAQEVSFAFKYHVL